MCFVPVTGVCVIEKNNIYFYDNFFENFFENFENVLYV